MMEFSDLCGLVLSGYSLYRYIFLRLLLMEVLS